MSLLGSRDVLLTSCTLTLEPKKSSTSSSLSAAKSVKSSARSLLRNTREPFHRTLPDCGPDDVATPADAFDDWGGKIPLTSFSNKFPIPDKLADTCNPAAELLLPGEFGALVRIGLVEPPGCCKNLTESCFLKSPRPGTSELWRTLVSDFTPIAVFPLFNDGSDAMALYIYVLLRTQLIRSQLADQEFDQEKNPSCSYSSSLKAMIPAVLFFELGWKTPLICTNLQNPSKESAS